MSSENNKGENLAQLSVAQHIFILWMTTMRGRKVKKRKKNTETVVSKNIIPEQKTQKTKIDV